MEYYVAPSFETFEKQGEPYDKGGKLYTKAKNPKTETVREIRLYTLTEYNKAYAKKKVKVKKDSDEYLDGLKIARGFKFGPIELVWTKDEEWLRRNPNCWYATDIGWYVPSTRAICDEGFDEPLPKDLKRDLLSWQEFLEKYWRK